MTGFGEWNTARAPASEKVFCISCTQGRGVLTTEVSRRIDAAVDGLEARHVRCHLVGETGHPLPERQRWQYIVGQQRGAPGGHEAFRRVLARETSTTGQNAVEQLYSFENSMSLHETNCLIRNDVNSLAPILRDLA